MYRPIVLEAAIPRSVRTFMNTVCDVYLSDAHTMLRLPRPEVEITQACNFAIAASLMNVISGASVVLYKPPPNNQGAGVKFKEVVRDFYPWDGEPWGCIRDGTVAADILYYTFRNPMAHAFGFQDNAPQGPINVSRVGGNGFTEQELEDIESADARPGLRLGGGGTLHRDDNTHAISLNIEPFYWGVREMLRRLCASEARMLAAAAHLDPMLIQGAPAPPGADQRP